MGEGNPHAILRCICLKEAFFVRQTDFDILGSEYHLVWWTSSGGGGGRGEDRGLGKARVRLN